MSKTALYLGGHCPPNMEAYLDSLLYRTREKRRTFDLVVVGDCAVPAWLRDADRLTVVRYDRDEGAGLQRLRTAALVVREHVASHGPAVVRQITQPRWHAPGVLLGAAAGDPAVWTRASASLFDEFREAPSPLRAWLVNNALGRSIYLSERLFTPRFGGVTRPWWARAELVYEERVVNGDRFSPGADPRPDLFDQDEHRVLTVGRISRRKGTDLLLPVAERLPSYEFVVVGPVQDEDLASEVDATGNISRHPPVDYAEMPGVYAAADIILSVSRLEWGGVSRAMLEAKATGRPVVAIDRERASDVADAVADADPDDIADAVRYCAE